MTRKGYIRLSIFDDIIYFIKTNTLPRRPILFHHITKEFNISKVTTRKYLREMELNNLIKITRYKGNCKRIDIRD